jgi:hypothetical protein
VGIERRHGRKPARQVGPQRREVLWWVEGHVGHVRGLHLPSGVSKVILFRVLVGDYGAYGEVEDGRGV